jgi:glutamyl-Q tRNA(Asp) synthetase
MTPPGRHCSERGAEPYRGRFAPSPTGPLHAGSLVAALASCLDARAHGGQWLVRIEDVDTPRCVPGADVEILRQLARCGLVSDEPPLWQSTRHAAYASALQTLQERGLAYPCTCTRKAIETAWNARGVTRERHADLVYPGTCRPGMAGPQTAQPQRPSAWRFHTESAEKPNPGRSPVTWTDRRLGPQQQTVSREVGDFVLRRSDGLWAYQLAVVVDDAHQGITHVVRGEDLTDNTARQILLQRALGLATPRYLHTPLVRDANGEKLSKQTGAQALELSHPLDALNAAARVLGLPAQAGYTVQQALAGWTACWAAGWAAGSLKSVL